MEEETPEYTALVQQFQRDINRLSDAADRNSRKRGLTKLIEEIPFNDKKKMVRKAARTLFAQNLVTPVLTVVSDPTEKCRELALKLLLQCVEKCGLSAGIVSQFVNVLCARIGGLDASGPFPEVSEELRLVVVQLLGAVLNKFKDSESLEDPVELSSTLSALVLATFTRVLQDPFPAVKREVAHLFCSICSARTAGGIPLLPLNAVRLHSKSLISKGLLPNLMHQHNKVRSVTLRALGLVIVSLSNSTEQYQDVLIDHVCPMLLRHLACDKSPSVRKEVARFCCTVLRSFYVANSQTHANLMGLSDTNANKLLHANASLVVVNLMLCGDESEEVAVVAHESLTVVANCWAETPLSGRKCGVSTRMEIEGAEEDNAELVCRALAPVLFDAVPRTDKTDTSSDSGLGAKPTKVEVVRSEPVLIANFLWSHVGETGMVHDALFFRTVAMLLLDGVSGWTTQSRIQYTVGLTQLFKYTLVVGRDTEQSARHHGILLSLLSSTGTRSEDKNYSVTAADISEEFNGVSPGLMAYEIANTLGVAQRSDEPELRVVAGKCGWELGHGCGMLQYGSSIEYPSTLICMFAELLVPLIAGNVPGGDTASQRCNAIRFTTCFLQGYAASRSESEDLSLHSAQVESLIRTLLEPISSVELYAFKETYIIESIVLFMRVVIGDFRKVCVKNIRIKEQIFLCFVCLLGVHSSGSGPVSSSAPVNENTSIGSVHASTANYNSTSTGGSAGAIHDASYKELLRYCAMCGGDMNPSFQSLILTDPSNIALIEGELSPYFAYVLGCLVQGGHVASLSVERAGSLPPRQLSVETKLEGLQKLCVTGNGKDSLMDAFMYESHRKSAFEALVRIAPGLAWSHHSIVVPILVHHTEPPPAPEPMPPIPPNATMEEREALKPKETPEEVMRGYAACRGEEWESDAANRARELQHLQSRLDLIGLLEDMLRFGSQNWEYSTYLNAAAEELLIRVLLPNLVWKAGRVESATRKLALAACYALLKAGSVKVEVLFKHAAHLVPAIVSHLDDYYDVVPRQIGCYCLSIVFERLRGAFSESAISNLYPQLLKRLDDSNDTVRICICHTLEMFMLSGPKQCYSSTMVGYTLDQLLIHLDDVNPAVQEAVLKAILQVAQVDEQLVIRKTKAAQGSHRTPTNCQKIVSLLELGYEVL